MSDRRGQFAGCRVFVAAFVTVVASSVACSVGVTPRDASGDGGSDLPMPNTCRFASGRPCRVGATCTDWCNACWCREVGVVCTAADCGVSNDVATDGSGAIDCDPAHITCNSPFAVCPSGQIRAVENGCIGECVPVAECAPIPCDPAFRDACPPRYGCSASTRRCALR